ncbi:hypothetical protein [Kocuria flava]|nr:hypothetical protein [Kocuria flava]
MRTPAPLPEEFRDTGFSVRSALDAGIERARLRTRDLSAPVGRGVRVPARSEEPLREAARALAERFPGTVVSRRSAALLWRMRVPAGWEDDPVLHLTRADAARALERPGVVCRRSRIPDGHLALLDGIPVTSPARTFVDCAAELGPDALVVLGDGIVCAHRHGVLRGVRPQATVAELERTVAALTGRRGVRRARRALERIRIGSDSAPETRLRLLLEDHGIGGLETDLALCDAGGFPLVQPDLAIPGARLSIQYEGAHHDLREQRVRDVHRRRATERLGWREVRIVAADLRTLTATPWGTVPTAVALVREALDPTPRGAAFGGSGHG